MKSRDEERRPLLGERVAQNAAEVSPEDDGKTSGWRSIFPRIQVTDPRFRFLPLVGCLTVLVNEGEYFFKQIGYFRAIEALYCIEYYHTHDPAVAHLGKAIPEYMCKVDSIQKKVATANGIVLLVRMTSAFIGTVIVGYLADKYGRRPALILHKVGTIIYTVVVASTYLGYPHIPIWVSFCGGLGGLIGANFDLNLAVLLAAYNDALTSTTQVATYFFITTSMQYVGQVSFPLLAGKSINMDGKGGTSHIALFISLGMAAAGLVISVLFFPETMKKPEPIDKTDPDSTGEGIKGKGVRATIAASAKSMRGGFQQSVQGVGATNVILLMVAMFLATTAIKAVDWLGLVQYPVIKFGWTYNQTTFVMAIQAVIYIFTYFVLLPIYNKLGARYGFSPSSTSLSIMLVSVTLLVAGSIFLGLSTTAPHFIAATCIYTSGAGMPAVMQAYIAHLVQKSSLGRLLAMVSLFQVGGKIASSALGPIIINAGIDSGNENLKGAIFFFAAIVFALSASALGLVALRAGVARGQVEDANGVNSA